MFMKLNPSHRVLRVSITAVYFLLKFAIDTLVLLSFRHLHFLEPYGQIAFFILHKINEYVNRLYCYHMQVDRSTSYSHYFYYAIKFNDFLNIKIIIVLSISYCILLVVC